ncbi:MAG: OmpH family outer membrane protein [Flavobacteriia bacterium]|nr:OmpH family outer membrane protein [Flavobacteriia bacterium]
MTKLSIASIVLVGTLIASCGAKEVKKEEVNTVPSVQPTKIGELKIAYYNQDTMKMDFKYYKQQDAIVTKKQLAFQKELETRGAKIQADYNSFMQRFQNQELSQVEAEGIDANIKQRQFELEKYSQEQGAKIEKETIQKLETISNKIDKFSEKYCKLHHIDILMIHAKGGQFNYINPKMNVTKEFTAFLNQNQEEIEKEMGKK